MITAIVVDNEPKMPVVDSEKRSPSSSPKSSTKSSMRSRASSGTRSRYRSSHSLTCVCASSISLGKRSTNSAV